MRSLLSTSIFDFRRWILRTQCQGPRWMSRSAEAHALSAPSSPKLGEQPKKRPSTAVRLGPSKPSATFESLGIRPLIASALYKSFPTVKRATATQSIFIPAILKGEDVLLKDDTGTGKSFGIVLALLSKARIRPSAHTRSSKEKAYVTSLMIVPHRDLAYQFLHWIERMNDALEVTPVPPLPPVAQVVVRGQSQPLASQISALRKDPPHILIGTSQAILDIFREDPGALQLDHLSTVVVDEADYMIDSVPNKDSIAYMDKMKKKLERHPTPTKQLLDIIYAKRVEEKRFRDKIDEWIDDKPRRKDLQGPQIVMSSATLRNHLKLALKKTGWLQGYDYQNITGSGIPLSVLPSTEAEGETEGFRGQGIEHCVLIISKDGGVQNIPGARRSAGNYAQGHSLADTSKSLADEIFDTTDYSEVMPVHSNEMVERFRGKSSPFNHSVLETIATAFALDVPHVALLVLPASAPVQRAVYDLRELGVNARGLDLQDDDGGKAYLLRGEVDSEEDEPVLLVSTLATTRGLDLPELTHVFIVDIPEERRIDTYLHLAGRVGRFGRGGRVISVLGTSGSNEGEAGTKKDGDITRMQTIFKQLDVIPTQFEHFD